MVFLFLDSYRSGLAWPCLRACHRNLSFLPSFLSHHPKRGPKQDGKTVLEQPSDVTTGNVAKFAFLASFTS